MCAGEKTVTMLLNTGKKGPIIGGLLGIVILFRMNQNAKKNIIIVGGVYGISVLSGIFMEFLLFH